MYATNVKNKPRFLVLNGMLVVSAIFLIGEELGFFFHEAKCLHKTLVMNNMWIYFLFKLIFVKNSKKYFFGAKIKISK